MMAACVWFVIFTYAWHMSFRAVGKFPKLTSKYFLLITLLFEQSTLPGIGCFNVSLFFRKNPGQNRQKSCVLSPSRVVSSPDLDDRYDGFRRSRWQQRHWHLLRRLRQPPHEGRFVARAYYGRDDSRGILPIER